VTASPSSFLASLVLPSRSAAESDPDLEKGEQVEGNLTDASERGESQQQKEDSTTLLPSDQSVGAALSHGASAVAANIVKAKNAMKKGTHPVETLNALRQPGHPTTSIATGIAAGYIESAFRGKSSDEGGDVGGGPTFGHGEYFYFYFCGDNNLSAFVYYTFLACRGRCRCRYGRVSLQRSTRESRRYKSDSPE